jgi:hypothetical protein
MARRCGSVVYILMQTFRRDLIYCQDMGDSLHVATECGRRPGLGHIESE